jgi:hypothetical protein
MGGENEKVLSTKSKGTAFLGSTNAGKIRMHENGGEVHFHDDANKLKVAVPVADYWSRFNNWINDPQKPLQFIDSNRKAELAFSIKRSHPQGLSNPPLIDVEMSLSPISIGDNLKSLVDFANGQ